MALQLPFRRRAAPEPDYEPRSLVAAASPIDLTMDGLRGLDMFRQAWQLEAVGYWSVLGCVHFATQFVSTMLSRVLYSIAEEGEPGEQPTINPDRSVQQVLDDFDNRRMGQSQSFGKLGGNFFLTGEARLLGVADEPDAWPSQWSILSMLELQQGSGGFLYRLDAPGGIPERIDKKLAYAQRLWESDLIYGGLADSSMKGVLEDCERLWVLGRSVLGIARNRVVSRGALLYPSEMDKGNRPLTRGGQRSPVQSFADRMVEVARKVIRDPATPAGAIPLPIGVPGAHVEQFKFLDMSSKQDARTLELRREALESYAGGLSLPIEVITGKGSTNHWVGWLISEDTARAIDPIAKSMCDALTRSYLWPTLKALGEYESVYTKQLIWPDLTPIIIHPDRSAAANEGHDRGILSDESWRDAHGFAEGDAPAEGEVRRRMAEKIVVNAIQGAAPEVLDEIISLAVPGLTVAPRPDEPIPVEPPPMPQLPAAPEPSPIGPAETSKTPPDPTGSPLTSALVAAGRRGKNARLARRLASIETDTRNKLLLAADAALADALKRAGNRVMTAAQKQRGLRDTLERLPREMVVSACTTAQLQAMSVTEEALLADAFGEYEPKARRWMTAAQRAALIAVYDASEWDEIPDDVQRRSDRHVDLATVALMAGLVLTARDRLYDPNPKAPARGELVEGRVDVSLIRTSLSVAGGANVSYDERGYPMLVAPPTEVSGFAEGSAIADGLTAGPLVFDGLEEARGIARSDVRYVWTIGAPMRPFEPHQDLDGVPFSDDDLSALVNTGDWPDVPFFYAGDHDFCQCGQELVLPEFMGDG